MGNESINLGIHDADLDNLKTIIRAVPTGASGAEVVVGTSVTQHTKLIEFTSIMVCNTTDAPIQYRLMYNASYSPTTGLMCAITLNPSENVVICKKTQKLYGSTRKFFEKASAVGLVATYSYKEYSS
jgi:hypothetical protein